MTTASEPTFSSDETADTSTVAAVAVGVSKDAVASGSVSAPVPASAPRGEVLQGAPQAGALSRPAPSVPRPPQNAPVVQIDNLEFGYTNRPVLRDVNLQVWSGEIFGLLGPNGSGKSTLFRLLGTLTPSPGGSIRVFGHDVASDARAVRRRIGVVFQSPALDKQLTARENLHCHGRLYGMGGRDLARRIDALLARFGLSDRAKDRVATFSGGMRRKVELAKAILTSPELLILDEPSTGLDPGARQELWQTLESLRRDEGVTIILTTHLMDEGDLCDRVAVLDRGQVLTCDTPEMLKADVGGDVITLTGHNLDELEKCLAEKFDLKAKRVGPALRIERAQGHLFVPHLVAALPGMIDSVALGRPTLEDVFIGLTGRRLTGDDVDAD